jgi:hypothetical protein
MECQVILHKSELAVSKQRRSACAQVSQSVDYSWIVTIISAT